MVRRHVKTRRERILGWRGGIVNSGRCVVMVEFMEDCRREKTLGRRGALVRPGRYFVIVEFMVNCKECLTKRKIVLHGIYRTALIVIGLGTTCSPQIRQVAYDTRVSNVRSRQALSLSCRYVMDHVSGCWHVIRDDWKWMSPRMLSVYEQACQK